MSLLKKTKIFCMQDTAENWREYIEILKRDDPADFDRLITVMAKLQKSSSDAEADQKLLNRMLELRRVMQAGRNRSTWNEAVTALSDYDTQMRAAIAAQQAGRENFAKYVAQLAFDRHEAESAVDEMTRLKTDNPKLLRDEPAVSLADLDH